MEHIAPLNALEEWYGSVCDGDWEHTYGVRIETLDNPGWSVKIDLHETSLAAAHLERIEVDRTNDDWMHCWVEKDVFNGRGGIKNLSEILRQFAEWRIEQIG